MPKTMGRKSSTSLAQDYPWQQLYKPDHTTQFTNM